MNEGIRNRRDMFHATKGHLLTSLLTFLRASHIVGDMRGGFLLHHPLQRYGWQERHCNHGGPQQ